jgi:hypothetical protein
MLSTAAESGQRIRRSTLVNAKIVTTEEAYLEHLGELLTPDIAGATQVDLVLADQATTAPGTC